MARNRSTQPPSNGSSPASSLYGFRPDAMAPVYGLAECSVGLTLQPPGRTPIIDRVRRGAFMAGGRAEPADANEANALLFPACGQPLPGHQLRIVDDHGRELPERQEGRLEFQGPSATAGYYRNPEATQRLFPHGDDWLDSGDRAYLANGDVYPDRPSQGSDHSRRAQHLPLRTGAGRRGNSRNPQGLRGGFASADLATGSEHLVVVAETRATQPEALAKLRQQIQSVG